MKKKGFTLIELLAVIVILAIIALIATPLVLKYIEKSRKESKVDSAYSFVRNLETEIANYSIKHNGKKYNKAPIGGDYYEFKDFDTDKEIDTTVKGDKPDTIKVCLSSLGQVEKGIFEYNKGKYYVSYDGKKGSISDKDTYDNFSCGNVDNKPPAESNNIMMAFYDVATNSVNSKSFSSWATSVSRIEISQSYDEALIITDDPSLVKTSNSGYALDISAAGDASVVAYIDSGVLYVAGKDGKVVANENSAGLFMGLYNMTTINFNDSFDTSNIIDMTCMFANNTRLSSLDLSSFDTSKVTNMTMVFGFCEALTSIDLSSFNTENVTTMYDMFYYCSKLTSLDLSSFNTSNVTSMNRMFYQCKSLEHIYVANTWDSTKASTASMFESCGVKAVELKNA